MCARKAMKLLLVQARAPEDPLAEDEQRCIARRIDGLDVTLLSRNALAEAAEARWLEGVDALVIGGSGNFSVNHALSQRWVTPLRSLLDAVLARALPTFGICFGHQLLGLHLGSKVETHAHLEEVGTLPFELTDVGRRTAPFSALLPRFFAHTGHSDHVVERPPDVELLARGEKVELQAFRVRGTPIYTTQFHPDLTGAEAQARYLSVKGAAAGAQKASAFELKARTKPPHCSAASCARWRSWAPSASSGRRVQLLFAHGGDLRELLAEGRHGGGELLHRARGEKEHGRGRGHARRSCGGPGREGGTHAEHGAARQAQDPRGRTRSLELRLTPQEQVDALDRLSLHEERRIRGDLVGRAARQELLSLLGIEGAKEGALLQ